jgi:hypothetical protein
MYSDSGGDGVPTIGDVEMGSPSVASLKKQASKKSPTVSGPKLLPQKATVSRQVFLTEEMWDELKEAARFHGDVFKRMGSSEGVSRNDLIDSFLHWALDSYWEDKGGRPTSEKDWDEKVDRHAEALKKQQQEAKK